MLSIGQAFFLAGSVKGVTVIGLPIVATGVLGAIMMPSWRREDLDILLWGARSAGCRRVEHRDAQGR